MRPGQGYHAPGRVPGITVARTPSLGPVHADSVAWPHPAVELRHDRHPHRRACAGTPALPDQPDERARGLTLHLFWVVAPAVFVVAGTAVIYLAQQRKAAAFTADALGIWLGIKWKEPWRDRRKRAHIPWSQIQEIRISPSPAGSAVDIVLSGLAPQPTVMPVAAAWLLALLPTSTFLQRPAILEPLADPVRYHAPLFGARTSEVAQALRALAPASVPVTETSSLFAADARRPT